MSQEKDTQENLGHRDGVGVLLDVATYHIKAILPFFLFLFRSVPTEMYYGVR